MQELLLSYEAILCTYGFTSLCMLTGAILTIRYTPYCIFNTAKRQTAMTLHRKKILFLPLTDEEEILNSAYKRQTLLFARGLKLIWWTTYLHLLILAAEEGFDARPIYYLSVPSLLVYIGSAGEIDHPYCVNTSSVFSSSREESLLYIQAYQKQQKSQPLDYREKRVYKHNTSTSEWYVLKLFAIQFGTLCTVTLDILFTIMYTLSS